ncbi:hypothetical protein [Neptunomonas sp.]|uniref:hypothetical protein n=1 Tax=Neptunomonas sp. TaxID=1971898 RepID=UPI0035661636
MAIVSTLKGPTGQLLFIDHHRPALPDGDYSISVEQSIHATRQISVAIPDQPHKFQEETLEVIKDQTFVSQIRKFAVQGPRFSLDPQVIHAVFPPAGSLGEHSSVLPHISFKRSTLPWERPVIARDHSLPEEDDPALKTSWMALLVFDQSEFATKEQNEGAERARGSDVSQSKVKEQAFQAGSVSSPKSTRLQLQGSGQSKRWAIEKTADLDGREVNLFAPTFVHESGQQDEDPVSVIDIDRNLLINVLPSKKSLLMLAHVRQSVDGHGKLGEAMATLIASRLPSASKMSVAHLVSLEGQYEVGSKNLDIWDLAEHLSTAQNQGSRKDFVRMISLKSWRFSCIGEEHSFKGLGKGLDRSPSTVRLPDGVFQKGLSYIQQGWLGLPHHMMEGNTTGSWYHGPLAPGEVTGHAKKICVYKSDQLRHYNPKTKLLDSSYAAAWELGRLLTLQNEKVAVSLFDWKRRHRHQAQRVEAMQALEHLPIEAQTINSDLPVDVIDWFHDLSLLEGVPFNYLLPDEKMLPPESLRFFWVDPQWVRSLHDGAFSIGRVLPSDFDRDKVNDQTLLAAPHAIVTGVLLRSELVSGWPDLLIEAYDERVEHSNYEHPFREPDNASGLQHSVAEEEAIEQALNAGITSVLNRHFGFLLPEDEDIYITALVKGKSWKINVNENEDIYIVEKREGAFWLEIENKLQLLKMKKLSPNVLLCLFSGEVKSLDIHQKPEALHFGFNRPDTTPSESNASHYYYRELKDKHGGETTLSVENTDVKPWFEAHTRVINAEVLASNIDVKVNDDQPEFTSAQFALQMAEGVQKVRYMLKASE